MGADLQALQAREQTLLREYVRLVGDSYKTLAELAAVGKAIAKAQAESAAERQAS